MGAASLEAAFSEYDQQPAYLGRGGLLDRDEFAVVCKAMGFSARAEVIFRSLDKDRSGEIGYLLGISLVSPWYLLGISLAIHLTRYHLPLRRDWLSGTYRSH